MKTEGNTHPVFEGFTSSRGSKGPRADVKISAEDAMPLWEEGAVMKFAVASLAACVLMSGCGGYLQEDDASADCAVGGVAQDDAAQPLAGARVSVQIADQLFEATTDASGRYELSMPRNYAYPSRFAGTATKDGYLPQAMVFNRSGASCPVAGNQPVQLRALAASDVVFPSGVGVTHLGDGVFTGDINSQLQVPSSGLVWTDGFSYSAAMQTQYGRLCLSFLARGVQAVRQNTIAIAREGAAASEVALMADTDPAGNYAQASYCFALSHFSPGDRIAVTIAAGNNGGVLDHDDFEFVSVIGTMAP